MKQRKNKEVSSQELSHLVAKGMLEKKGLDIVILDLRKVKNAVADFFVLCSGTVDTHVDSVADSVEAEVYKATEIDPWQREGKTNREWILIDYVDVVAHVFKRESREFYGLDELWGDAEVIHVDETFA